MSVRERLWGFYTSVRPDGLLYLFVVMTLSAWHLEVPWLLAVDAELWVVAGLGAFLLSALLRERPGEPLGTWRFLVWAVALLAVPLVSSVVNDGRLQVILHSEYRSWAKALLVLPLFPWVCRAPKQRQRLLDAVLIGVTIFALIVFYRFFVLGEMRVSDDRPSLKVKNGDPNFICVILAVALPLLLYRLNSALREGHRLRRVLYVLAMGPVLFGVAVTESRMGILSVGVGLVALAFALPAHHRRLRRTIVGLAVAFSLLAVAAGDVWGRLQSLDDSSNRERVRSLQVGAQLFWESPWVGAGWNSSPRHFYRFASHGRLMEEARPIAVHNTPLQLLGELGILGLLAYGGLYLTVGAGILRAVGKGRTLGAFCLGAFVILSLNLLSLPLTNKDFVLLYLAILGTLVREPMEAEAL